MKIAANTQHTGDRAKDHRGYATPMTSEQLDGLHSPKPGSPNWWQTSEGAMRS